MIQEPRSFVCDAHGPMNLIRANAVFASEHEPYPHQRFVHADRRFFKDRPVFRVNWPLDLMRTALPGVCFSEKRSYRFRKRGRRTLGPSPGHYEIAVILK